jgi:predicted dehydrogenase
MASNPIIAALGRRLRLGVIGGGPDSFIGIVHRGAARLEEYFEVVAGVLSSNPERSRAAGRSVGLDPGRAYGTAQEMLERERARSDGIDVLAIMTPNDSHYRLCCAALEVGLDVVCEKPLANGLDEALDLVRRINDSGRVFCLAYGYTGYPMVRQARAMVRKGLLGEIRMVKVEYVQGHLSRLTEAERGSGGNWHMDPAIAGPSLILGDIGTHAFHLAAYVTDQQPVRLAADLGAVVPGRAADDYVGLLLRLENGARGVMWVTQAAAGAEHGLCFRVFGEHGGLEWHQEHPNQLHFVPVDQPAQRLSRGGPGLDPAANRATHIAIGHPEGYREAFANLYCDVAEAIVAQRTGHAADPLALEYPSAADGARGVKFVEAAIASSRADGAWTDCSLAL